VFRGRFEHTIDDKNRIAIPARFRDSLASGGTSEPLIITNLDHCLCAYPLKEWERVESLCQSLPQFDSNVLSFQRYFLSSATECTIDKAGRITIPPTLRDFAELRHDCVILGNLHRFEIWSNERWKTAFAQMSHGFERMTTAINNLGIRI
jgi:MraZ protein